MNWTNQQIYNFSKLSCQDFTSVQYIPQFANSPDMDWKAQARDLLDLLKIDDLKALLSFYWKSPPASSGEKSDVIAKILEKVKDANDLLTRRQLSVDVLRKYLDPTGGVNGSSADLKKKVVEKLNSNEIQKVADETNEAPVIANEPLDPPASSSKSKKHGRDSNQESEGAAAKKTKNIGFLDKWWKIRGESGTYYSGILRSGEVSDLCDTGVVVEDRQPDSKWGYIVAISKSGIGFERYELGEPIDNELTVKVVDMFGPWPAKMNGGNAVNQQLRTLLSTSVSDMRSKLMMGMNGDRLSHMELSNLLYRTLQLSSGLSCRDTLISQAKNLVPPLVVNSKGQIEDPTLWSARTGVPTDLITDLEALYNQFEALKEVFLSLQSKLFKKTLQDLTLPENPSAPTPPPSAQILKAVYDRRLKVIQVAELRAVQSQKEAQAARVSTIGWLVLFLLITPDE